MLHNNLTILLQYTPTSARSSHGTTQKVEINEKKQDAPEQVHVYLISSILDQ